MLVDGTFSVNDAISTVLQNCVHSYRLVLKLRIRLQEKLL